LIGRLTGKIVESDASGTLVVDVHGVGYEVDAPLGTAGRATPDAAGASTLFIHTVVREDAFLLYGFATRDERETFRSLIAVANVGPKTGVALLSAMTATELSRAIGAADVKRLSAVPGIGKKTADRIILELKGKLLAPPAAEAPGATAAAAPKSSQAELLTGALTRMGYRPAEAERAIEALGDKVDSGALGDLVREALALLAR
jgi:Holliday junction DNA helicase RuvA